MSGSYLSGDLNWPPKVDLFGMGISVTDYEQAVAAIIQAARRRAGGLISCHAVHAVVTLTATEELKRLVNDFDMITPDGQPVRWAMNLLHKTGMRERVYGPELMLRVCRRAAEEGLAIYLYGGSETVLCDLQQKLCERFPDLVIAGAEAPPFRPLTEAEEAAVVERINESGAALLFIGLGCPKQDLFAHKLKDRLQLIQICVGAAFDFHAGAKRMAPSWMQAHGLEWFFRLYQEPGRLWRRYLTTNLIFLSRLATALLRGDSRPHVARQRA